MVSTYISSLFITNPSHSPVKLDWCFSNSPCTYVFMFTPHLVWHVLFHPCNPCLEKSNPSCKTRANSSSSLRTPTHTESANRRSLLTTTSEAGAVIITSTLLIRKLSVGKSKKLTEDIEPSQEQRQGADSDFIHYSKSVSFTVASSLCAWAQLTAPCKTYHILPWVRTGFSVNQKALRGQTLMSILAFAS